MKEIGLLILGILGIYVFGSTFLFWYWAFKGKTEVIRSDKERYYFVFIGSLVGIGIFFYAGIKGVLFFIPESCGGIDEEGYFVSLKSSLAGITATIATFFVHARPHQLVKFFKSKED